jgi:hypothetical protein
LEPEFLERRGLLEKLPEWQSALDTIELDRTA